MQNAMMNELPLILLPGLGADSRMFSSLATGLPPIVTPRWIEPHRGESLVDYARRFAEVIDPGRPFYIGGASFGGVMAQEVAALLPNVRGCFVIGSTCSDKSRPWRIRVLLPITPLVGILPRLAPWIVRLTGRWLRPATRGVLMQLSDTDPKFLSWGAGAILRWKPSEAVARVPVCQIHGSRDLVFPVGLTNPDYTVPGAGHLIAITHPKEVSQIIRQQIEKSAQADTGH